MSKDDSTVEYRPIKGFPGYRVGNDGSVWSCWEQVGLGYGGGTKSVISNEWHRLSPIKQPDGRFHISLKGKQIKVHRLILLVFVGPCPRGMQACHFPDRNPANNKLENLRWDTPKANQADSFKHGTRVMGEASPNAKLDPDKVRAIRSEYATGKTTLSSLGKKYSVNLTLIHRIVKRLSWAHVK